MENEIESDNHSEDSDNVLIEDFIEQNNKRKLNSNDSSDVHKPKKKKKLNKKDNLYKQPTVEELNELRETETLFHSNLFRIQIEELLDEVKVKQKYNKLINSWFEQFVENIKSIEESNEFQLNDNNVLKKSQIEIPFQYLSDKIEGTMKFVQPHSVKIIGSYNTNSMIESEAFVDIMIEMPPTIVKKVDFENYTYLKKRAVYLSYIAANLDKNLFETVSFYGNQTKPILKIVPSGKLGSKVSILVHCTVHVAKDKYKKCLPYKSNIETKWYFEKSVKEGSEFATPYYNSLISHDLTMSAANDLIMEKLKEMPHMRDAIILLKVWLRQRQIGQNFDDFNSHVLTCYVLYLLQTKKINTHMSSYQIVRNVWLALVQNDWTKTGFSLHLDNEISEQRIQQYKQYFKCTFVDVTGYHNITSYITEDNFKYIQSIANDSLECLKEAKFASFSILFMSKIPLYRSFETILCIHDVNICKAINKQFASENSLLDYGVNERSLTSNILTDIIKQGLNQRLDNLMVFPQERQEWSISEKPPANTGRIYIGMNLNRQFCFNIVEKGPDAKTIEAEQFRKFWGEKSELRHFKDGTIREAIVWGQGKTLCNKRYISKKILTYLVQKKLGIPKGSYFILSTEIEKFLQLPKAAVSDTTYGTGEEATLNILNTFNELNRNLRNLKEVPLTINGAQGISCAFRYTEVFPSMPSRVPCAQSACTKDYYAKLGEDCLQSLKSFVSPLEIVIQLSSSGKWPDELEALRKMKGAFNLQIAGCLRNECKLKAQANTNYVDVLKDGYVFRLHIALQKEIALVKEVVEDGITKYVDNEESMQLEQKLFHLPKLNSALHGLYCTEPAFGSACRLAKRWLAGHLIDNWHFSEIAIELIMASIFLKPLPYKAPNMPQVAFLRFLGLCLENNWQLEPIIVNFNNELSREKIVDIENFVTASRESLPPLVIFTPYDDKRSIWTQNNPSSMILTRVSHLAKEALKLIEVLIFSETLVNFDPIFKPFYSEYDFLIRLKDDLNPVHWQAINFKTHSEITALQHYKEHRNNKIPVINFNPVQLYLKELRNNYGEFALFFHDTYGGSTIAILLKPSAVEVKEFKVTMVPGRKLSEHKILTLNVSALLEGFYTLGQGLVENIEFQSKRISLE